MTTLVDQVANFVAHACGFVGAELSDEEWAQHAPGIAPQRLCPQ